MSFLRFGGGDIQSFNWGPRDMSLLTELFFFVLAILQICRAYGAWKDGLERREGENGYT